VKLILWCVCRKPELRNQKRQPLLENDSANTAPARQWLSSRHVMAARDTHATTEELLEPVFSVRYVEVGSNTSTVALRVVGGDAKGTQCLGV
jgi:hypothetical protein